MKGLFKIEYTYKSYPTSCYDGREVLKNTTMFLEYDDKKKPIYIPTNRLSGFERATIVIKSATYLRDQMPIELNDVDFERNELGAIISLDDFLVETLEYDESFENSIINLSESNSMDIEEALESLGYKEVNADNTYNYCSDLENDINFKVFSIGGDDYFYDENTVIVVYEHYGLDARAGYSFKGIYKNNDFEGLSYFYDLHVRVWITDMKGNEVDDYDGDYAIGNALKEYTLKSVNEETLEIIVTNKDGEEFEMRLYSPAYGV